MSQLLKQARQRVDKVLELVGALEEDDFPHPDSTYTLRFVKNEFSEIKDILTQLDPELHDPKTIRLNCRTALDYIFVYLPVIGFVARSTSVVGAIEMHRPLKRIVEDVVGPKGRLLLTSDWTYSPYTYVHRRLVKKNVVLVSLPASESANGLIIPLAGHEIGHNVWSSRNLDHMFDPQIHKLLVSELTGPSFDKFKNLFEKSIEKNQVDDLYGQPLWAPAFLWTRSQCQEMFCDFVGLLLFRESYLHAFEYLLSPGGGRRDPNYPSMKSRAKHLVSAAKSKGIHVAEDYADSFDDETSPDVEKEELLLEISDLVLGRLFEKLLEQAVVKLAACQHNQHSEDEKKLVIAAMRRGTPSSGGIRLVNLVNAVWEIEKQDIQIWKDEYPRLADKPQERSRILNELLLKSLEILEIEYLQKVATQC